jgi:O-antigen/teichoic acid export membrane protein
MTGPGGSHNPGPVVRRVSSNTAAQAAADVLGKLAVLGIYAVVARQLGAVAVGQLTFALSVSVLLIVAGLGTDPLIAREIARDRKNVRELLWPVLSLKFMSGGLAAIAIVVVALVGSFGPELRLTLILIAISGLIDLLAATLAWVLRGLEEMVPAGTSQVIQRLIMAAIAIGAMLAFHAGVVAVAVAYVVGSAAGAAFLVVQLSRRHLWPAPSFSLRRAREVAIESLPLAAGAVLSTVLARLDAILLAAMATLAVVGTYGAAYRLIESTFFIGWAFGAALFPMLSRLGPDTQPSLARVFDVGARVSLAGMLPVGAIFVLFPAPVIGLIYGPGFEMAIEPTRWLGIVAAVNGFASLALFALLARDLKGAIVRVCLTALIVNLILNLALIPVYGATGAAIAMAAANLVLAVMPTWIAVRDIGPIHAWRLIALTAIAFGVMAGARFLLGETWLGLAVGLVAYGGGLILAHHWLFPGDTRLVLAWLRQRAPAGLFVR